MANFSNSNLSDLLSITTPVFMKNYGPGNISTSSFRGGNASQTAVLWNGFNIQNPMLGQNDFSQLPNFMFDGIGIEYGGSGALWGSGSVGGSIHLNNNSLFNKGFRTLLNLGAGSYESRKLNSRIHYSNTRFSSTTKVYYSNSENNFTYFDTIEKKQTHSSYEIKGVLQELSALFSQHKITARAWYNSSFRNYGPSLGSKMSKACQQDKNLKLTADYIFNGRKFIPGIRIAYFDDALDYTDSLAGIFSNNATTTFIGEGDIYYKLNERNNLYAGLNYTDYKAITENYSGSSAGINKTAFLFGYNVTLLESKLKFDFILNS